MNVYCGFFFWLQQVTRLDRERIQRILWSVVGNVGGMGGSVTVDDGWCCIDGVVAGGS
jgi:hypothetical protein